MIYKSIYKTPVEYSDMIMYSDGEYLIGLRFEEAKDVNYILKLEDNLSDFFKKKLIEHLM